MTVGLNKTVTLKQAIVAVCCTLLLWLGSLLGLYLWASENWKITLPIENAPFSIQLPKYMPVKSSVNNQLNALMNHTLDVTVPVDQWIDSKLPDIIHLDIQLNTEIRLKTIIRYQDSVEVSADFELMVPITDAFITVYLPVKLPMKFKVPVDLSIPIDTMIPVALSTPVTGTVPEPVPVKLSALLHSQVPIHAELNTKVLTMAEAQLIFPTHPIDLQIARAALALSVGDISLVQSRFAQRNVAAVGDSTGTFNSVYDAHKKPPVPGRATTH